MRAGEELEASNAVEAYEPKAGTWTRLQQELPFSTRHAHVLTYGRRLLVVSTHNDEGRVRIALLDPAPELEAARAQAATTARSAAAVAQR